MYLPSVCESSVFLELVSNVAAAAAALPTQRQRIQLQHTTVRTYITLPTQRQTEDTTTAHYSKNLHHITYTETEDTTTAHYSKNLHHITYTEADRGYNYSTLQ